ncbi:MAG: glutamate 5-kinase [Clostridia bacterium]
MIKIREQIKNSKKIVIKVGTSSLMKASGKIHLERIAKLAQTICELQAEGRNLVLITSGAIGVGMDRLNLAVRPTVMKEKQAAAAVGQCELMSIYSKMFWQYDQVVAQILLTVDNVRSERDRQNVINTFDALMQMNVVPIVNENDTVSTIEISVEDAMAFNENDSLSAIVANLIGADLLIILSDIDGFYDADPKTNPNSKRISVVRDLTSEMECFAGGAGSQFGTGGMVTKLRAAKIANDAGAHMILASGEDPHVIKRIIDGNDEGSIFVSEKKYNEEL